MNSSAHVTVIAEAGVNHNGDLGRALELIEVAASGGADVVKFQTFTADAIALPTAPKAGYQEKTTPDEESQFEMLRRLELSPDDHWRLKKHADACDIGFLSTPFDRSSLSFLVNELGLDRIKLPSSDLTNIPLLVDAGRSGASLIVSTGMSSLGEVEMAMKAICFGLYTHVQPKNHTMIDEVYSDPAARMRLRDSVVLLHCTSNYPAAIGEVNLRAMGTLHNSFGVPVGYSDHTQGITAAIAATALGAVVIEKHLTLDRELPGPDHAASSEPAEFSSLVQAIREVESMLGSPIKSPASVELDHRLAMRKGLYAARDISAGIILSEDDIAVVRPTTAVGPEAYFDLLGSTTGRELRAGDPLA